MLSGQFYQVFSHFASLGDQARLYLLKNRVVGRFLDILLNGEQNKQTQMITEKYRNETLKVIPLFKIEKEFYLESNLEKTEVLMTIIEKKNTLRDATPFTIFLAHTLSMLTRSCRFVKSQQVNPYAIDNLNYTLDEDEISMIINCKNDQWWLVSGNSKLCRNSIADMFAHISYDNKEFSFQLISVLLDYLSKVSFDNYKKFERALVKQVLIKDQYQPDRTKKTIQGLHELMKQNVQYYKDVDSLIEIVYKLAQRSQLVIDLLNKQSQLYRFIEQWSKEYPHMPLNQAKTRIFSQGIVNWNAIKNQQINQQFIDRNSQYTKERIQRIQSLIQKEIPPNDTAYDSDDDMYDHKFQEKERIDFKDHFENYYTGTIEIALDEMVRCVSDSYQQQMQKPAVMWIETESDKLSPPNTISQSEKKRLHNYYLKLLNSLNQQ